MKIESLQEIIREATSRKKIREELNRILAVLMKETEMQLSIAFNVQNPVETDDGRIIVQVFADIIPFLTDDDLKKHNIDPNYGTTYNLGGFLKLVHLPKNMKREQAVKSVEQQLYEALITLIPLVRLNTLPEMLQNLNKHVPVIVMLARKNYKKIEPQVTKYLTEIGIPHYLQ